MDNKMILLIGGGLLAVALGLIIYTVLAQVDEKAVVRDSLRQLEGYEVENVRDQELLAPITERALMPVLGGLTNLGRRFTPVGYVDNVRKKFINAGQRLGRRRRPLPGRPRADRSLAVIPLFWFCFIWNPLGFEGFTQFARVRPVLRGCCLLGPDADPQPPGRRSASTTCRIMLPDVLDLLTIRVEAGLGFEQALDRTDRRRARGRCPTSSPACSARSAPAPAGATPCGPSTSAPTCPRSGLRSVWLAILQADTFGVSIGRVLRAQSEEMRIKRRQLAQEKAQKAPVKMLIPMVFCIFPALFVVVIGPAIINIRKTF